MPRVLIIEGPNTHLAELHYLLASDPQIELAGYAHSPQQALAMATRRRPDVMLIGLQAIRPAVLAMVRSIAEGYHAPIILLAPDTVGSEFQPPPEIVAAGAQALLSHLPRADHPAHPLAVRQLLDAIKLVAEIKVVRRRSHAEDPPPAGPRTEVASSGVRAPRVIAIGASTGGPAVLRTVLSRLPADYPIPILIVQHMAHGFIKEFAGWLATASAYRVELAEDAVIARPGVAYIAPDDRHLGVTAAGRLQLSGAPPEHGMRASVSYLFRSVLDSFGADATAVLLTGMGKDGAAELKCLRTSGALTLIQDRASAAVYGMAGEAAMLDAACAVLDPTAIGDALASLGARRRLQWGSSV